MTLDEQELTEALHGIDAEVAPTLIARARAGGKRRLVRRRSLAAAGALAVGGTTAPIAVAVGSNDGDGATLKVGASPPAASLYAAPPPAGSECNGGHATKASPADHRDLLLLPPTDQQVRYAFVRDQTSNCAPAHVALTAYTARGGVIGEGLVVEGPNAPTPVQDGRQGPNIHFYGDQGQLPIDGRAATEYTIDSIGHTDAYWTEPDGGQWHAIVRGLAQADAVALLNRVQLDSTAGSAVLPGADADGWSVVANGADRTADQTGLVLSQWTDPQGHLADMTVTQTPDRTYLHAVDGGGPESLVTVRGRAAVLAPHGGNGGGADGLTWQESKNVEVQLEINGATAAEIEQVAESLVLASPADPRFALGGG